MKVKIEDIKVKNRIRKDVGDLTPLKDSMKKYDLLYPVVVDSGNNLIAGERRLRAAQELGWDEIDVVVRDLSSEDTVGLEMAENTTRKQFTADELVEGIKKQRRARPFTRKIIIFFGDLWIRIVEIFTRRPYIPKPKTKPEIINPHSHAGEINDALHTPKDD